MREVAQDIMLEEFQRSARVDVPTFRWQAHAIMALQEAAEAYLVHLFEDA